MISDEDRLNRSSGQVEQVIRTELPYHRDRVSRIAGQVVRMAVGLVVPMERSLRWSKHDGVLVVVEPHGVVVAVAFEEFLYPLLLFGGQLLLPAAVAVVVRASVQISRDAALDLVVVDLQHLVIDVVEAPCHALRPDGGKAGACTVAPGQRCDAHGLVVLLRLLVGCHLCRTVAQALLLAVAVVVEAESPVKGNVAVVESHVIHKSSKLIKGE